MDRLLLAKARLRKLANKGLFLCVRIEPIFGHVEAVSVNPDLEAPGEVPKTRIRCLTKRELADRIAYVNARLEEVASSISDDTKDIRAPSRNRAIAGLVAGGSTLLQARNIINNDPTYQAKMETRRVVVVNLVSIHQIIAEERQRTLP